MGDGSRFNGDEWRAMSRALSVINFRREIFEALHQNICCWDDKVNDRLTLSVDRRDAMHFNKRKMMDDGRRKTGEKKAPDVILQ